MDHQMENQLFQGNQATQVLHCGDPLLYEWNLLFHVSIMDLQMENQLFQVQVNQATLGSPLRRSNCFRGTKKLQFRIMDLQMENQLIQGNQAVLGSPWWRSNTGYLIFHFIILDQAALRSPIWRSINSVNNILYFIFVS